MRLASKWIFAVAAATLTAFAVSACSKSTTRAGPSPSITGTPKGVSGSTAPPQAVRLAQARAVTVTVDAASFQPKDVSLAAGTNLVWIQKDAGPHLIVSGTPGHEDGKFKSPSLKKDSSFTIVPQTPGTYPYFDQLHPSLTAQLVVTTGGSSSPPGGKSP
jgi:plastocyanin